jgi:hypothetical protein
MLLLLSLMALAALKVTNGSLKIAGNNLQHSQGLTAAQGAIEQVISTTQFATTPAAAVPQPCNGVANTTCVDIDGDGAPDINVAVAPTCTAVQVIPVAALNFSDANDAGCIAGANQDFGVANGASNNSMCANMVWDIQATASDTLNNAKTTVHQGIAVRVPATTVCQ